MLTAAALFDIPPPLDTAPMRRSSRPGLASDASEPCPWRIQGKRCNRPVPGIDPMRTCDRCFAEGAPARVPWEMAKPEGSATCLPQIVIELRNAHLSEMAVHAPAPKEEVGDFTHPTGDPVYDALPCSPDTRTLSMFGASIEAEKQGTPVEESPLGTYPCGHPRRHRFGFCGACTPARL